MVLHFMTIREQNIAIWLPQSVGALGVATIFGKMNGVLVFVEGMGGRLDFSRRSWYGDRVRGCRRRGEERHFAHLCAVGGARPTD
jgi:hypothetical protein